MKKTILLLVSLFLFANSQLLSQSGQYDMRFTVNSVDCSSKKIFLDLEIKAFNNASSFNLANHDLRFKFNPSALRNPALENGLSIAGLSSDMNGNFSIFDSESISVSNDSIATFSQRLSFGPGYYVTDSWVSIFRVSFDLIDVTECLGLVWTSNADSPSSIVSELFSGSSSQVSDGVFITESSCLSDFCVELPVELVGFEVASEACSNVISWSTYSETDNNYFNLQKSADGLNFESIARINGAGESSQKIDYKFNDHNPFATSFYRLVQVDFNGDKTYSPVISSKNDCFQNSFNRNSIYPNPLRSGNLNVNYYSSIERDNVQLRIVNNLGQTVLVENGINLQEGLSILQINCNHLSNGSYQLFLHDEDWASYGQALLILR